jgi:hypothetical protein
LTPIFGWRKSSNILLLLSIALMGVLGLDLFALI